ncbi:DUF600 family protein [Streptomonospora nanhaiensis]|uniref:DUF600 family protein n=1 Tax=Streptomonospora nanhaiensis TaxID=1323731 RepID=A0ABY6YU40_9ACTN|nr:immunity protein YezG family protein [Streptomonospora nanhaiensis]WAE75521.1 DUF600 family protein [Streptomonospora nanhaiensis]
MSIEGTQEHLQKIGTTLFGAAPEGWTSIEARMSAVGHVGQCLVYVSPGSQNETRITTPGKISGHFMRLRKLMYHEGKGAWYTATFTLKNTGSFNVDYDYDDEPNFLPPEPGPREYQLDHQHFPRDEENIPEWLRQKLREAEQGRTP